jgi:hypothetical protein
MRLSIKQAQQIALLAQSVERETLSPHVLNNAITQYISRLWVRPPRRADVVLFWRGRRVEWLRVKEVLFCERWGRSNTTSLPSILLFLCFSMLVRGNGRLAVLFYSYIGNVRVLL